MIAEHKSKFFQLIANSLTPKSVGVPGNDYFCPKTFQILKEEK